MRVSELQDSGVWVSDSTARTKLSPVYPARVPDHWGADPAIYCTTDHIARYQRDEFLNLLTLSLPSSKSTFPQPRREKCIIEVVRIGSIIIFYLSKVWEAKFFTLCDVIFLVRLKEKFEMDHFWSDSVTGRVHSQSEEIRRMCSNLNGCQVTKTIA